LKHPKLAYDNPTPNASHVGKLLISHSKHCETAHATGIMQSHVKTPVTISEQVQEQNDVVAQILAIMNS
jgi:hypothetical protein